MALFGLASAVAVFCEDIREEVSGAVSLIGVMQDNTRVPDFPFAFPKFAFFGFVTLPVDYRPKSVSMNLSLDAEVLLRQELDLPRIIETFEKSIKESPPTRFGITMQGVAINFAIRTPGILRLTVNVDGEECSAAATSIRKISPS